MGNIVKANDSHAKLKRREDIRRLYKHFIEIFNKPPIIIDCNSECNKIVRSSCYTEFTEQIGGFIYDDT